MISRIIEILLIVWIIVKVGKVSSVKAQREIAAKQDSILTLENAIMSKQKHDSITFTDLDPNLENEIISAVEFASKTYHVPKSIIYSVIAVESSFDTAAVSQVGCVGLMQVNPDVWGVDSVRLLDPKLNILVGTDILAKYKMQYGSWKDALYHYSGKSSEYVYKIINEIN